MSTLNKVTLIGYLGRDPETRSTAAGDSVAQFTLATTETWKDKATGEKREATEWHRVVLYRKLAEIAGQYLKKGSLVYVEGRIQTRSWEGQDGQKRRATEIVANDVQFLDRTGAGGGGGYERGASGGPEDVPPLEEGHARDVDPDDIPF